MEYKGIAGTVAAITSLGNIIGYIPTPGAPTEGPIITVVTAETYVPMGALQSCAIGVV